MKETWVKYYKKNLKANVLKILKMGKWCFSNKIKRITYKKMNNIFKIKKN